MVQLALRYVISDKDRHGNVRYYFRRHGRRKIRLHGTPGSMTFQAAYEAAARDDELSAPRPEQDRRIKEKKRKEGGYVYFLRVGDAVKIGYSGDVVQRLGALRTGLAREITSLLCVPGSIDDERRLHRLFARNRLQGEWFRLGPNIEQAISQTAIHGTLPVDEGD